MQTTDALGLVLCFGVAFALIAGAGAGGMFGESPADAQASKTLEDIGDRSDVQPGESGEGGVSADVSGDNEPTLVGVAIDGGQFTVRLVAAVTIFPYTLIRLNFPWYFAVPIGSVLQVIAVVGLYQFLGGREYL